MIPVVAADTVATDQVFLVRGELLSWYGGCTPRSGGLVNCQFMLERNRYLANAEEAMEPTSRNLAKAAATAPGGRGTVRPVRDRGHRHVQFTARARSLAFS